MKFKRESWQRGQEHWGPAAGKRRKNKVQSKKSKQFIRNICKVTGHVEDNQGHGFYGTTCTRCGELMPWVYTGEVWTSVSGSSGIGKSSLPIINVTLERKK